MQKGKKWMRKLCALTLTASVCLGATGCDFVGSAKNFFDDLWKKEEQEKEPLKDSSVLNIMVPDSYYSDSYIRWVAKAFTAKTGIQTNVKSTPTEKEYKKAFLEKTAEYDIYIMETDVYSLLDGESLLASYDDVYNAQVPGESVLFKDKMKDEYERYSRVYDKDGGAHYYSVPAHDSITSFVIQQDVWQDEWEIPVTTDELLSLAQTIKDTEGGYTPFIYSSQASYWWDVASLWVTQYQGLDDMYGEKGFWAGYDEKGNRYVAEMWQRQGFLEALTVLDELVKDENGYQHELSEKIDYTTADGYFMQPENKIAMMPNGDWIYNLFLFTGFPDANWEMIATPVVSAIRNHPDCEGTIGSDMELSALIKAIDQGSTALTGDGYLVSQKAFDKVFQARNIYSSGSWIKDYAIVSPAWTDAKKLVNAFLLYLASEEGQIKYVEGSGGYAHCFERTDGVIDAIQNRANEFRLSVEKVRQNKIFAPWGTNNQSALFTLLEMPISPVIGLGYERPELIFASDEGYKNAETVYLENYQNALEMWEQILSASTLR